MIALFAATMIGNIFHDELLGLYSTPEECVAEGQTAMQEQPNLEYICVKVI